MSTRDAALRSSLAGVDLTPDEVAALGAATSLPCASLADWESECPSIGFGLWVDDASDTTDLSAATRADHSSGAA